MFRPTNRQVPLFPASVGLPKCARARLDQTWATGFRDKVLGILLDVEDEFSDLYSDNKGRPNWSIARMLSVEILKEAHDLDDQSALDALAFDVRWQHALDLPPEEAYLSRRSLVEFRSRLVSRDAEMTRIRILFDRVGEAALSDLGLSTRDQRIDSTRIVSNIRTGGRVNLFRKTLEHFGRELQARWPGKLEPLSESLSVWLSEERTGWFGAGTKEEQRQKLQQLAEWLHEVEVAFIGDDEVTATEAYQLVVRLLREHCRVDKVEATSTEPALGEAEACPPESETPSEGAGTSACAGVEAVPDDRTQCSENGSVHVLAKPTPKGASLQSPYDPDAAYGHKGSGYHVQITETCNNDGPEILTDYDVAPANEPDWGKTDDALDRLNAAGRLPERFFADAGYPTGNSLLYAESMGTELIAPVTRARVPADAIGREEFTFDDITGDVVACPTGHAPLRHGLRSSINETGPTRHAFFDGNKCRSCPLLGRCLVRPPNNGKKGSFHLELLPRLRARDESFARQQQVAWKETYKIRSGIEATNSELKRVHGLGRLRVRRMPQVRFAVACKLTACNVKRWLRASLELTGGVGQAAKNGRETAVRYLTFAASHLFRRWRRFLGKPRPITPHAPA